MKYSFLLSIVFTTAGLLGFANQSSLSNPVPSQSVNSLHNTAAQSGASYNIYYCVKGQSYLLNRPVSIEAATETQKVLDALSAFIQGPSTAESNAGVQSAVPSGTCIVKTVTEKNTINLYLDIPTQSLAALGSLGVDEFYDSLGKTVFGISSTASVNVLVYDEANKTYKPLTELTHENKTLSRKPGEEVSVSKTQSSYSINASGQPSSFGQGQPSGFLSGKSVFLSAGHGWYYDSGSGTSSVWNTQRGNTNNIVEDFSNIEAVDGFLTQYLWNAGANVYTCRARSRDDAAYIVDNTSSSYSETGSWNDSTSTEGYYGTNYRTQPCAASPTATATWTPTIASSGYYPVYIWYTGGSNRATDARVTVHHAGGDTLLYVNMQHDGYTWKYLGTFYFKAGNSGYVRLTNESSSPSGMYVIADAVRVGDGMGEIQRGGVTSGKHKTDECSRYWAEYMGAPSTVYIPVGDDASDDVTCRPRYAEWERESWEDPVYISWHTNAYDGSAYYTSSYAQSANGWDGTFTGSDGSLDLRNVVHNQIVADIKAGYDSSWGNGYVHTNNYGELRLLSTIPGAIFEITFHDNATKGAPYLKDPLFRQIVARAVYKGIVKYYANRDSLSYTLLPEPPQKLKVVSNSNGSVSLSWSAPSTDNGVFLGHPATSYKVYRSFNGYGFDNGTATAGTSMTVNGLSVDSVYYFKVTALNAGGESFPTETLAVRVRNSGYTNALIVYGYDQSASWMMPAVVEKSTYTGSDNGSPVRMFLDKINNFTYVIQHAEAIKNTSGSGGSKYYFDSANHRAVEDGSISLSNYQAVIWISGRQSTESASKTLSATEQSRLAAYLNTGKGLFISGSEIGWDLGRTSGSSDSTFYANYLRSNYVSDDASSYLAGNGSGILNNINSLSFDDGSGSTYAVDAPDVLQAYGGSATCLQYNTGSVTIDNMESIGSWKDPNYAGQTNADAASSFAIVSSPVHQGSGCGDLYYVWGTGTYLREYDGALPQFPAASNLSFWIYGDNSGHNVRISLRDSDNDIMANPYLTVNFSGWQQVTWNDIQNNPGTFWNVAGDGVITSSTLKLDSINLQKVTSTASGHLYFDDFTYTPTSGSGSSVAGIQYNGGYKLVYLGFPFETITSVSSRNALMTDSLNFLIPNPMVPLELTSFDTE